jgi:glycosyltransferase involved in cell wall biosynthesis
MKIGLFTNTPDRVVGCKKVVDNLKKGFNQLGQYYVENMEGDMNGCIHGAVREFQDNTLPPNTLIGPEIMVLPSDMPDKWTQYKNWCQPSKWVVDYMKTFPDTIKNKFYVWPVGIDTDDFKPEIGELEQACVIYYKNVTKQTPPARLHELKDILDKIGITYKILEYGDYKEDELKHLCNTSNFGIMLTGTESQGIAYMEMLSMGLPLYVIDEKKFEYYGYTFKGASSAPYFDERCGIKHDNMNRIGEFMDKIQTYNPRQYILDNHTCKHGAQKYIDILSKCHASV